MTNEEKLTVFKTWLNGTQILYKLKSIPDIDINWQQITDPIWDFDFYDYKTQIQQRPQFVKFINESEILIEEEK